MKTTQAETTAAASHAAVQCKNKKRRKKTGPKPQVSQAVFVRVCEAFGHGLPLANALAAEGVPKSTWHATLNSNPVLSGLFLQARDLFLAKTCEFLADHADWRARTWLLERRFVDLFKKPADVEVNQTTVINQLPADLVQRARELAKQRMTKPKA
jgi:hypothetical protein